MFTDMHEQQLLFRDTIRAIGKVLDFDERLKLNHASRVALCAYRLGFTLGLSDPGALYYAGFLHDVGAIGLADHVVHHAEQNYHHPEARLHSHIGARIIRPFSLLRHLEPIIADHHEHVDGSGFPSKKRGDEIAVEASVVLLADLIDVELRAVPAHERLVRAKQVCRRCSGTKVPSDVADAGLQLLDSSPELIDTLFNDAALDAALQAVCPLPPTVDGVTRAQMLSQLLWLLARLIDTKHTSMMGHSTRVAYYAHRIGLAFGDNVNASDVLWSGFLHDVGKVGVPRKVLEKLDKGEGLTEREKEIVREHATDTRKIIETIADLSHFGFAASSHHEHYDGSGYPQGLQGEAIPLIGRILAFADHYDRLTHGRASRSHDEAMEQLSGMVGTVLDPHLAGFAFEVLDKCETRARQVSPELLSFQQFFNSDLVDVSETFPDELDTIRSLRALRQGVLLSGLEPWSRAKLSRSLEVLDGVEFLQQLVGASDNACLSDMIDAGSFQELLAAAEALGEGQVFTRYVFTPQGNPLEFVLQGEGTELLLLFRSAENRVQSMKRLALFYRNFLSSFEAVVFTDPAGFIIDVNRAFLDLYGYEADELIGRHTRVLNSGKQSPQFYQQMWGAVSNPAVGSWSGEFIDKKKSGEEFDVRMTINAIRDSNGAFVGFIAHVLDISARKHAERQLRLRNIELQQLNEKLQHVSRFKSDLMAITSHDLRGPLGSLANVAILLRDNLDRLPRDRVMGYLDRMIENSRHLSSFVSDILDLEKIESGSFQLDLQRIRFDRLVAYSVQQVRNTLTRPVEIVLDVSADAQIVVGADPSRMEQVFANLLTNAVKFSPDNATILVKCDRDESGDVRVQVCDQGPGVPEEALDAVFDRYYQVKAQGHVAKRGFGTGLGLNIVKNLVQLHGGTVRAANQPGSGAVFSVQLPVNLQGAHVTQPLALYLPPAWADTQRMLQMLTSSGMRVMIADDMKEPQKYLQVWDLDVALLDVDCLCKRGCSDEVDAVVQVVEEAVGGRPLMVGLCNEMRENVLFDRILVPPVLATEVANLVYEVRLLVREHAQMQGWDVGPASDTGFDGGSDTVAGGVGELGVDYAGCSKQGSLPDLTKNIAQNSTGKVD